ncbi:hypothetical protein B0H19DRAFT_1105816 [Mycena capillaripes]|nr:hypothetical protein B0H19DRAFT_1105816 [Mycena capillaripes]
MEDAPPAKRQRTDDADAVETVTPVQRSLDYWFDDGNIILQVESTQFRLLKSILSMHSTVFRDMFMLPLPVDEPTIENCPVVKLNGDTAQDWIHLLGVMFPKSFMEDVPRLELVAAILRLSKKYDFPVFRKDCIHRLKVTFPTEFEEYDNNDDWTLIREKDGLFIPLLSLAREIGLYSIRPLAYYLMITIENGTYMPRILKKDASLSDNDRFACLMGYANLLAKQSTTTMAWLNVGNYHIASPTGCRQRSKCLAAVKAIIFNMSQKPRPNICVIARWDEGWEDDLCGPCVKKAKEVFEAGRETCWKELLAAFGLPDWEKLKELDLE